MLLAAGADPDVNNSAGETPRGFVYARDHDRVAGIRLLRRAFDEIQGRSTARAPLRIPKDKPSCVRKHAKLAGEIFLDVSFYWLGKPMQWRPRRISVFDLVYARGLEKLQEEYASFLRTSTKRNDIKSTSKDIWKWIHFPANNVSMPPAHQMLPWNTNGKSTDNMGQGRSFIFWPTIPETPPSRY